MAVVLRIVQFFKCHLNWKLFKLSSETKTTSVMCLEQITHTQDPRHEEYYLDSRSERLIEEYALLTE